MLIKEFWTSPLFLFYEKSGWESFAWFLAQPLLFLFDFTMFCNYIYTATWGVFPVEFFSSV